MPKPIRLVLTGGGTGGHILPNIALIEELKGRYPKNLEILYIGSRRGMEVQMIQDVGVPYKGIFTGKIRRYFSLQNLLDMLKLPMGILQAFFILLKFRPKAVFCKGGFVSFPVAFAAWLQRIPVVLHESDTVPGLANKVSGKFARKICVSFEETKKYFPEKKVAVTGNLVRREILRGDVKKGQQFTGFDDSKRVLLVMGGSQGSLFLNELVWNNLDELLQSYQVVHICGKGKVKDLKREGYKAFEYVDKEMKDLYALADVIVSRSGANTLAELSAVGKPALLVPLTTKVSRGDQIHNAYAYEKKHAAFVLEEDKFQKEIFHDKLKELVNKEAQATQEESSAAEKIILLLEAI